MQETHKYGTHLEYQCSLAKEFKGLGGGTVKSINMTCGWNGQWSPVSELTDCVCKFEWT